MATNIVLKHPNTVRGKTREYRTDTDTNVRIALAVIMEVNANCMNLLANYVYAACARSQSNWEFVSYSCVYICMYACVSHKIVVARRQVNRKITDRK